MKKQPRGIITTYGVDTTDMTADQTEALKDPESPVSREAFIMKLREARQRLLARPDFAAASEALDREVA